jgi:2-polyprenyl-3-methyl-5-hydroxy-6-metoxy-1,4-benzoquinol methylase
MSQPPEADEARILRSWSINADPWIEAIRSANIESRKNVTDRAIVAAVTGLQAERVLDLGCGEGWLARALGALGMKVTGVDAVASLVEEARRRGGGDFHLLDYDDIASGRLRAGPFDAAVCNFSLLGRESVQSLLAGVSGYLNLSGHLVIQTLHPLAACGDQEYRDGWREGHWTGFGARFTDPAPWYFRRLETWLALLPLCGFEVLECREPTAAGARAPASVIFICRRGDR